MDLFKITHSKVWKWKKKNSLTGSSNLNTREKKRIKITADDLVIVYLE